MSTAVTFEDEAAFTAAIADVRSDTSDLTYAFCGHVDGNPNVVSLLFTGTDSSEIGSRMDPTQAMYGLARYETQFDMSTTVKFVYIHWSGEKIPFTKRGRYGVVQGSVRERFTPWHSLLEASSPEDLDKDKIIQDLMETAGTKSKVLEGEAADLSARQMRGFTQTQLPQRDKKANFGVNAVASKGASVDIQADVYEGVARVRNDEDTATWMVAGYDGGDPKGAVRCVGIGEGNVEELKSCLDECQPMYGLYRFSHTDADEITQVKFAYIIWVGTRVKSMTKGKISTHKGAFEEIFCPAHATIFASELTELDETIVLEKVLKASGAK